MQRQSLEAEACALLDQLHITMFGKRIHNPYFKPEQHQRPAYDIHPYSKQGSGVSCTITYTDAETKIIYVLLAKKKSKDQYDQIGGYTRGVGPEGSEVNFEKRSEDQRDLEEERLIGNEDAVQVDKVSAISASISYSLKQLKEASVKGFEEQQIVKLGKKINPFWMKESLKKQGIILTNDFNCVETAVREAKEETDLDLQAVKPKELYTSDDFGITNEDPRLHNKTTHYLFHLGTLTKAPAVKPGSDIQLLKWVPITEIDCETKKVKNDLPIRLSYVLQTLPRAIKKIREMELKAATHGTLVKYKNLQCNHLTHPFSIEASEYHQAVLAKGCKMTEMIKEQLEVEARSASHLMNISR